MIVIFGPLVAPRTSTVTDAWDSLSASEVTFSPSTRSSTGSDTESPTPWVVLSISMTSPTETFCWVPPLRTIAYTATHSPVVCSIGTPGGRARVTVSVGKGERAAAHDVAARAPRQGSSLRNDPEHGQNAGPGLSVCGRP